MKSLQVGDVVRVWNKQATKHQLDADNLWLVESIHKDHPHFIEIQNLVEKTALGSRGAKLKSGWIDISMLKRV